VQLDLCVPALNAKQSETENRPCDSFISRFYFVLNYREKREMGSKFMNFRVSFTLSKVVVYWGTT
jgi:hypothetical protein